MHILVLVRHGETVGNSSIRYHGRTDVELSELGRQQMHAARRWLRRRFGSSQFAPMIASPLRRAAEGAAIIAGADCEVCSIEEFVEVDFGLFEGLTADEIRVRYPADFERWDRDRLKPEFTYPAGESRTGFTRRVEHGIRRMLEVIDGTMMPQDGGIIEEGPGAEAGADRVALLVAHRGVIRIIAQRLARAEPIIELGSIQILRRDRSGEEWRAESLDVVEQLADLD